MKQTTLSQLKPVPLMRTPVYSETKEILPSPSSASAEYEVVFRSEKKEGRRIFGAPTFLSSEQYVRSVQDVRRFSKKKGGLRKAKGKSGMTKSGLPPARDLVPTLKHKFQFKSSSAGSVSISILDLAGALGGFCTTANSKVSAVCSSFRLISLTAWPCSATSGIEDIYLDWNNAGAYTGFVKDSSISRAIPLGMTQPGGLIFRPPKNSLASFWLSVGGLTGENLFAISFPNGALFDLEVEYTLPVVTSTVATLATATVTTGTLGNFYYLALDGPASNKLPPIDGMPTTS